MVQYGYAQNTIEAKGTIREMECVYNSNVGKKILGRWQSWRAQSASCNLRKT